MSTQGPPDLLMGLDLGGGSVRCLLLDPESAATTAASRRHAMRVAPGTSGLGWDLDLPAITRALAAAIGDALAAANAEASQVRAIATTGMRFGTVLLSGEGEVLLAVPNRDARAVGPGLVLAAQHGDALQAIGGHWPYPIFGAARLRWLAESQPELLERAAHFLSISDWMTWLLCGEIVSEPSQAGESLLFDLSQRAWSWEWIDRLEIPRHLFPDLANSGERVGAVDNRAASLLGLAAGTPVCIGGADTQCGLLGVGAVSAGDTAVIAGTTAPVMRVLDSSRIDTSARLWTGVHIVPEHWVLESNAGPVGDTLDWLGRLLFPNAPPAVGGTAMLLAEACDSAPGAMGMMSTLGVEVMNARTRSIPIGNLTLSHMPTQTDASPRRHLARSVIEGIACGLRANAEQLTPIGGEQSGATRLGGGLSRSRPFAQTLANVLDAPVLRAAVPEATALGAALCAAVGAGVCEGLEAAATRLVREPERLEPEAEQLETHRALYQRWSQLHGERATADASAAAMMVPFALQSNADAPGAARGMRPKILITSDCDEASLARLREICDVEYASFRDVGRMLKGPTLVEALQGFQVFVTEIDLVDAAALEELPDLRVIVSCRGDAVNVDVDACTAFGVPMLRTPGRNADAVADLTLAFMLMLSRKLPEATAFLLEPDTKAGDMARMGQAFVKFRGKELWKKTIGLVGLGAVGRKVCQRLAGFGTQVLVSDPYVSPEQAAAVGAQSVPLETLLAQSDFVSLHAAVTPETTGIIGAAELAGMKPGACLINTARAALIDEDELVSALQSGHLGGAGLDTFAIEPPSSDHPLLKLDNVIATPHVGGNTEDVAAHQGEIVADELGRLLSGGRPLFAVNPEALDDFGWSTPRRTPDAALLEKLKQGPAPAVSDLQKKKQADEKDKKS